MTSFIFSPPKPTPRLAKKIAMDITYAIRFAGSSSSLTFATRTRHHSDLEADGFKANNNTTMRSRNTRSATNNDRFMRKVALILTTVSILGVSWGFTTRPAFLVVPHLHPQQRRTQSFLWRNLIRTSHHGGPLRASSDDDDNDDEQDDEESKSERRRKRDQFKDWVYGSSSEKPMVKPIGLDGEPKEPPRVKSNLESLFAGMPSMEDILGGAGDDDDSDTTNNNLLADEGEPKQKKKKEREIDDSWFDEEKKQILLNYEDILDDMLAQLKTAQAQDPESVPANAEAMIKSVLKQEMDTEIAETMQRRAAEKLDKYQDEQHDKFEKADVPSEPNESVQKLIDQSEAEYLQQEANRLEMEDFLRYEKEAVLRAEAEGDASSSDGSSISRPAASENLDQWALDRLQDMAGARQDVDGAEMTLDILEENIEDLEYRMKKEADRSGSIKPETMKEWQMYRSIATGFDRSTNQDGAAAGEDDGDDSEVTEASEKEREEKILAKLDSWKDYIQKEEGIRKNSGLSRGPKLPFAWQESAQTEPQMPDAEVVAAQDKQSRIDVRKQLNRMSIEAMENLLETSDPARRERLEKEIEYLKATLEEKDFLDIDESAIEDAIKSGPVDTSDLFQSYSSDDTKELTETSSGGSSRVSYSSVQSQDATLPSKTPFFEDEYEDSQEKAKPPPNTAFFADDGGEEGYDVGETLTGDSKLGSMEDQKLEAMYRRAGAKTPEEREAIRSQWEAFQEFEKTKRDQSGLSNLDDDDVTSLSEKDLKYNVSEVLREDGDFDAETILSTIGPRPKRKKKGTVESSSGTDGTDDEDESPSFESDVDKAEVMDSLYRAVSAVGGGRYKEDPKAKAQQQASFQEYLEKENKVRESLDDADVELEEIEVPSSNDNSTFDDVEYAEEVLSSLGSRPQPKRARVIDPGDYSDMGGVLASEDDDNEEDDFIDSDDSNLDMMPEWLRKEQEEASKDGPRRRKTFLGSEIDEVFDDTDYEHNMRQLAEYERRRAGNDRRQIGIDISDVLGRGAFNSDDYADFKHDNDYLRDRKDGWGLESFAKRKSNLLDYIELDVQELNALMDHKDSIYSTGVSQYLPRINKPFREFGAIFRLEGVLLDVTGLQLKAWTKVADQYGFKKPLIDDVRQAAVSRPEVAVKDIFFWTDDFLECRDVAASHMLAFREVFNEWMEEQGISVPAAPVGEATKGNIAIGQDLLEDSPQPSGGKLPSNEAEKMELLTKAWERTAGAFGKGVPSREEVLLAATLSPDIAVMEAFQWSVDPLEVDDIARAYRQNLQSAATGSYAANVEPKSTLPAEPLSGGAEVSSPKPLSQDDVMELHYQAWKSVAESKGFKPPDADEVLVAFTINEPEIAARGFGWTEDPQILNDVVRDFENKLNELTQAKKGAPTPTSAESIEERTTEPDSAEAGGPSPDELFRISFESWTATAAKAGLPEPDNEQVQFALSVGPEEAIVTGFEWATDADEVAKLVESYKDELSQRRGSWQDSKVAATEKREIVTRLSSVPDPEGPSADEVYRAAFDAWTETAKMRGFPAPDDEQVQFAMTVGPEEAIVTGFGWTDDSDTIADLAGAYKEEIGKQRRKWKTSASASASQTIQSSDEIPMFQVKNGAASWVRSLLDVEMQCGVVSYLERDQLDVLLQHAGLDNLIARDKRVSFSNGYMTDKDQILGAALRLERRPDHCVVFDSTPYASVAAHDVEMQSVGIIGPYPRYDLLSADATAASFDELTAMNIRRLFSERVYDQPMVDIQQNQPETGRSTKTRFFFDED